MSTKIMIAIAVVLLILALGFAAFHYNAKSAGQAVQTQCIQADQTADRAASDKQHQEDQKAMAELQAQLRQAQKEAADAQKSGRAAETRAASLSAALKALRSSDSDTQKWADQKIPAALHQATMTGR